MVIAGGSAARLSEGIQTPISATALAMESIRDDGTADMVIMVSLDLVGVTEVLYGRVQDLVRAATPQVDVDKIILNATLSIEALDFNATCTALARAAQSCGGYVSSTSIDTPAYEGAYRTAYYQFRIPAEQYSVFLEGAGSAGNLVSKQESTQDVTSAYVDVEARLKSLKLQEERLYAMMEQAGFTNVVNLGSLEQASSSTGIPVVN